MTCDDGFCETQSPTAAGRGRARRGGMGRTAGRDGLGRGCPAGHALADRRRHRRSRLPGEPPRRRVARAGAGRPGPVPDRVRLVVLAADGRGLRRGLGPAVDGGPVRPAPCRRGRRVRRRAGAGRRRRPHDGDQRHGRPAAARREPDPGVGSPAAGRPPGVGGALPAPQRVGRRRVAAVRSRRGGAVPRRVPPGAGIDRAPHRHRERRQGPGRHGAGDLPVPHDRPRLRRHRLPPAGRPVRRRLRGTLVGHGRGAGVRWAGRTAVPVQQRRTRGRLQRGQRRRRAARRSDPHRALDGAAAGPGARARGARVGDRRERDRPGRLPQPGQQGTQARCSAWPGTGTGCPPSARATRSTRRCPRCAGRWRPPASDVATAGSATSPGSRPAGSRRSRRTAVRHRWAATR